jgi:uncharacterized coiled-coil protein SlyX
MTFANVNIGSYAGDNTGDPLRTAFDKINKNFANITAGNVNVTLNAPVMSVAGRIGNIVLNVNDVSGAVGLGRLTSTVNAANVAANAYTDAAISNLVDDAPLALDTLKELADLLSDESDAVSALTTIINQATNNQNAANVYIYDHETRIDSLESNAAVQGLELRTLTSNASVQSNLINAINSNVVAVNLSIGTLQNTVTDHTDSISDLYANAAAQSYNLFVLSGNAAMQHGYITELRANITAANAVIAQHTASIDSLLSNAAVQSNDLVTLTANAAVQSSNIATLIANAATQSGTLTTLISNAAVQSSDLTTLTANAASQATSIQTLLSNAISQAESLTNLVGNAVTQAEQIQSIETDVDTLQTQVYTNSNTQSYLGAVAGNIIPAANITYDLGSSSNRWKDLYLSDSTIYIGSTGISASNVGLTSTNGFNLGNSVATAIVTGDLYADYWVQGNIGVAGTQFQFTDTANVANGSVNLLHSYGSLVYESTGGAFKPSADNSEALGTEDTRWGQVHANLVSAETLSATGTSTLNIVEVDSEVSITDIMRLYRLDTDTVTIETFSNLNLTSPGRTAISSGGNIELDTGGLGNIVIPSGGIVLPDGSYLTTASAVDLGNIRFNGDSITSTENGDKGITINASGAGEVVISDNLGINNINPAYALDIGNINENENSGSIGLNFNNNVASVGRRYGSALVGWDWWDQNGHGTNNDGTEHYRFGIYNGNVAPFSHAWLSFDRDAPANSITVNNEGAVNIRKLVSNGIKSNVQVRHTEVETNAPSASETIDVINGTQWLHTANTEQNFEFDIQGNSTVTLDSFLGSEETITVQYTVVNGATAYHCEGVKIDGVTQSVKWSLGGVPTSGTVNGYDLYNFIITKLSANSYVVLGQQQKYS